MQKLKPPSPSPLVGAQGYQRLPLSKHVVGQNVALDAVPAYMASLGAQGYQRFPLSKPVVGLNVA